MSIENTQHFFFLIWVNIVHAPAWSNLTTFNMGIDRKIPKKHKYVYFSQL